ncbi:autotransporter-associated beta strand repeat-containing protein [Sphingomonas sp. Sphisp140]|uniref:autotransporter-associated beta strand repeat-containing protein n=1 Tax=unclassified Sphingomonas TaxID=196159 RepID=UPI0039B02A20
MVGRGNGVGTSRGSVRVGREALLRKALLGSTALIGITLATPALAQSTSPAGGGTISGSGTYTDDTAANGGVMVDNTQSSGVTMTGVTINNTTGNPNGSAYRQNAAGGQSAVLYTAGANSLRSDQNGAALFMQAGGGNLTWAIGQTDTSSTTDLNATFGAYLVATGFINVVDFGTVSSLRNVTGISGDTGIYATSTTATVDLSLKAPTISGFATGINALSATGANVTTTGGTITTLANGTGIAASASNAIAAVNVTSGSAITTSGTGIGINVTSSNTTNSVTTTAGGTINGGSVGIQMKSAQSGQTNTVTVGAAIGNSTRPSAGVLFNTAGAIGGLNTVYANADILAGNGSYAIGSGWTNTDLVVNVASGVTVSSQGSSAIGAGHDVTIVNNGTISATAAGGTGVRNSQGPSTVTVTNNGTMTAGSVVVWGAATTNVTNSGIITATNNSAIISGRGGTITNNASGHITGGSAANGWAIRFDSSTFSPGQTVNSDGQITGGGAGAIRIDATTASTLNLNATSQTSGLISVLGSGATTVNLAGALVGDYDGSGSTGAQNFRLGANGSMQSADFGSGNDTFTWAGGAFSGTIDGGAGTDTFAVDVGSSTNKTLDLTTDFANLTNFDAYSLVSGNLTLTGSRNGGAGWTVAGGNATTFILNGSLTNIAGVAVTLTTPDLMFVQSGAQLSASGDVIYSSGTGNNIQNSGTITSGTGASSAIAIGSGTVDNYGTITYAAGGSITTQGNGVLASTNQLSLGNHSGATLIGRWDGARANNGAYIVNDGLIQGDRFAGVEITGISVVQNNATGRIYGATGEGSGLLINSGAVQVTNAGQIVGAGTAGIYNAGSGLLSLSNSGTIGTGTLDGSNNYVQGGTTTAIRTGTANITNTGSIRGASGGIAATGALTLVNIGMVNGVGTGTLALNAVDVGGVASILNAGTISEGTNFAISATGGGTVTNAVGASLGGGSDATNGYAVFLNGGTTFNNYGQAGSGTGGTVLTGSTGGTINLFAGSASGRITGGAGNDTLAIYTGQTNASAVTQGYTNAVTGSAGTVTLQNSGALAAATFGTVDLGGGSDTLQLRGTGNGVTQGEFSLATATGAETITKLDSGTWRLSGAAVVPGITVNSNGGTLLFQGTSGIGTINANGGIVRADGSGAFGSAVVHLLSSNVQFAASGAYANNFVLDVPAVLNGQPAVFENLFGGNAILSGSITSGSGTNAAGQAIGASQAVTFAGVGGSLFNLTGTGNSWTGITTINSGVTVRGSTSAISGGSITNNGTLTYVQSGASSIGKVISGSGALRVEGGQVTLTGFNTYTGGTTVAGGSLQVGDGAASGRITGAITVDSGGTLIFNRTDNYDFTSAISGAGNVQTLGTVSLSGAITNTGNLTVDSATGGQVTLTGSRSGANASGVYLGGSGNILRVGLSGSVAGGQYVGVRLDGVNDGVDNFGAITNIGTGGDNGYGAAIAVVATTGTSTINNGSASNSTASISGQNAGINHVASGGIVATGALNVNNYGLIAGNLYNAIENQGGSGNLSINNYATGRIVGQGNAGGGNGIGMGGVGTLGLDNAGLIVGRSNGIATGGSVAITNRGTIATGTLSGGTSGTLTAGGGTGIQAMGGTITNQAGGVIQGSFLNGSGTDTNAISSFAATTVNNSGQILGASLGSTSTARANGVYIGSGLGTVTNYATGLITGSWDGVYLSSGGSVTNTGTISGYSVNGIEGAGTVTNNAGGRIFGGGVGVKLAAGGTVNNSGLIAAATYDSLANTYTASTGIGVTLTSGTVINQYTGTITGATGVSATGTLNFNNSGGTIIASTNAGVNVAGTSNQLYNSGTLTGGSNATQGYGVRFTSTSTGSLNNQTNGLISGGTGGFLAGAATGVSIDNGGAIVGLDSGSRGIYFSSGSAIVTNQADGVIVGQGWGIQVATTANINNSGFIGSGTLSGGATGTFTVNGTGNGVVFNGGYFSNNVTGTVTGGNYGVASGGTTAANISNAGTITGGTYAIYLTGTNADTVSLFAGSTTNGAIALGNGDDTLNWYGGSFTSINGEGGNDRFAATVSAPATLDLSTLTGFEQHSLNGGDTLTLTGTQLASDGGWRVTGSNLVLGGTAKLEMTGTGVTLVDANASLTVSAGGQLIAHDDYGVAAFAGGSVTNAGLIKSTGGFDGVITNGGTVDNQAGGRIIAAGNGVTLQAAGATLTNAGVIAGQANGVMGSDDYQTLTNTGVIVAGTAGDNATAYWQTNANLSTGDGVRFTAGGSVTNVGGYVNGNTTGIIVGGANGVTISGGAATIENSGTLQGNSGYGISIDTAGGVTSTITNHNGGALVGGTGAALLSGDGTVNMTNEAGSYMYGSIVSTGNGTRNIDLSGVVYGDYDATSGAGVDNVTLRSGTIANVNLGDGDDTFVYIGGNITGMVDGGAGSDMLFADFGAGTSYDVSLANFSNFEGFGLTSGDVTLTGTGTNTGQAIYAGYNGNPAGTITFQDTGDLTGDIYVNGGSIRANTAGAFGSGTIHMIDPTATFAATGTYANNISLEVVTPSSANPSTLNTTAGVIATLTGAITTGTGAGVDPDQQLVIGGQGTIVLTNAANSWSGSTIINAGATLQGTSATISGSGIVANGTLAYVQPLSGTVGQNITGNGTVSVSGLEAGEALSFSGSNTVAGGITVLDGSAIINSGTLAATGGTSVTLANGGSFTNDGTVTGQVRSTGAAATGVTNTSTINGTVYNAGTGALTVDNQAGATIQGSNAILSNAVASVTNAGTLRSTGTDYAIGLLSGGTILNSGSIEGGSSTNDGWGVNSTGTLVFTNQAGGSIGGAGGAILSFGGATIDLQAGSTTNGAIQVVGSDAASVTVAGNYTGIIGLGAGDDMLTLDSGATIGAGSMFNGNGGSDTLVLAGTGNASLDIGTALNFETRAMNGTGVWTLTGSDGSNGAWQVNSGTLAASGGSAIGNGALVTIAAAGTLQLLASEQVGNIAGSGAIQLGANALMLGGGTSSSFGGTISGTGSLAIFGGTSLTLTGAQAYTGVTQVGGTLTLAGSNLLADASSLSIQAGGTVDLGAGNDTVAEATIAGTLNGTGTLTTTGNASLTGGIVNANLAGDALFQDAGTSTLNGTAAFSSVSIRGGTLALGASNRLADNTQLGILAGAALDLGAYSDTIGTGVVFGTVNGTGTLTANLLQLNGATINANLGGTVMNIGGTSVLNGTASGNVEVGAGTLVLGAANRLADTATVLIDSGATLDIGAFNDTIGIAAIGGTLAGSGTLTAGEYQLGAATVNANLGAGTVYNLAGTSTLNGTAAGNVSVQGGTLVLGAANRLADTATVAVASGATLDIGAFSDTVGALALLGTLNGSGTLAASQYQLTGATVNANLGAGTLFNLGGDSTLNGTVAGNVLVNGGTLRLGAAERLADTATLVVASGATFDLGANSETVAFAGLSGTLAGTGTLIASEYQLNGATVNANLGAGTVFNLGGTSTLNGTAAGNVSVQAGTLALGAANRLADTAEVAVASGATLDIGAFNETIGALALLGTLNGTGMLTASQYQLTGATVNANLAAGTVFNLGGTSTLNGTAAGDVVVQAGTLRLGAANRIADAAVLDIGTGATFDLGAFNETVALAGIGGTLAGTGTLTASQYQLSGATVNANLAGGTVFNVGGVSTLNGTSAAGTAILQAGTLRLGASERLANNAAVSVNTNAVFDLAGYTETIASLSNGAGGGGTLALGAGKLVLSGNADSGFSGNITGSGVFEKQGTGRLTLAGNLAMTGRIDLTAGTLVYAGTSAGGMRVQGGTLIGSGSFAGNLTVASGTFSPGGLATGLVGSTIQPIGSFTAGSLNVTGGTLAFDFGGASLNFASDSIRVTGAATLSGGTVTVNSLSQAASDYRFNQLYTIVQAGSLTGTFGNGATFTNVANNPNLRWRLRYDLLANAVVLQVQKNVDFATDVPAGSGNLSAVAGALTSATTGNATDEFSNTLNTLAALSQAQRIQAYKSFSGEALTDISTATMSANNLFADLLRDRVGNGGDSLVGGGFGDTSLSQVRSTATAGAGFASRLANADAPGGSGNGGGIWGQAYGGYQKLLGGAGHVGVENTTAGVAMGAELRLDGFTAGVAGGVAEIDGDVNARNSTVTGNQYQLGGYASYDAGSLFVSASGTWYSSDFDTKRTIALGGSTSLATGDAHADGYSFGASAGYRAELGGGLRAAIVASVSQTHDSRDGFTERASGGLGLSVAKASRDVFTATGELRLAAKVKTGSGYAMPWVSAGVRYNSGDLDSLGNMRFAGAPTGTGAFLVEGARMAPVLGTLGVGIDAHASDNVRLGIALEAAAGDKTREGRASVRVKIGF